LAAAAFLLFLPVASSAATIHAHRGGPNLEGVAAFGENSMSAFRNAAESGWVVEMDLARTSDGVAVAMHDDTLDRTTDCDGKVDERTWAELAGCRIDRIGIGDPRQSLSPGDPRLEPIPDLGSIVDLLEETGATANMEVKNLGTGDFSFASEVYSQLAASGLPPGQVIVQNFIQGNLEQAPVLFPGVATSYLTLGFLPIDLVVDTAVAAGYDWVSPQWPITARFVARARAEGLRIAPWTIDDPADLLEAGRLGVDAVISNDPARAERLIGPRPAISFRSMNPTVRSSPGRVLNIRLRIENRGDADSGGLTVSAAFPSAALRIIGPVRRGIGIVPAGEVRNLAIWFRLRPTARTGSRPRLRFRLLTSGGAGLTAVSQVRVTAR
jgi:glycerophosphoryl diester phosphodiesterase